VSWMSEWCVYHGRVGIGRDGIGSGGRHGVWSASAIKLLWVPFCVRFCAAASISISFPVCIFGRQHVSLVMMWRGSEVTLFCASSTILMYNLFLKLLGGASVSGFRLCKCIAFCYHGQNGKVAIHQFASGFQLAFVISPVLFYMCSALYLSCVLCQFETCLFRWQAGSRSTPCMCFQTPVLVLGHRMCF